MLRHQLERAFVALAGLLQIAVLAEDIQRNAVVRLGVTPLCFLARLHRLRTIRQIVERIVELLESSLEVTRR